MKHIARIDCVNRQEKKKQEEKNIFRKSLEVEGKVYRSFTKNRNVLDS